MATALTYRFRSLAILCAAVAVAGSLLVWGLIGGSFSPDGSMRGAQALLQAWTVAVQILIWLTAVFAAGAVATRVLAVAKGWDDDADGTVDDDPDAGGPGDRSPFDA